MEDKLAKVATNPVAFGGTSSEALSYVGCWKAPIPCLCHNSFVLLNSRNANKGVYLCRRSTEL